MVGRIAGSEIARLEAKPDSESRAGVVAEIVDEQPEPQQTELRALAEQLRAALVAEGQGATIDNRITVIATHGGMAAGRDQHFGAPAHPGAKAPGK